MKKLEMTEVIMAAKASSGLSWEEIVEYAGTVPPQNLGSSRANRPTDLSTLLVVGVYGETVKELVHGKFGDGIMSAIDYSMHMEKEDNPAGDREVITWNGNFLRYSSR